MYRPPLQQRQGPPMESPASAPSCPIPATPEMEDHAK
jgi:hypothetical protein